MKYKVLGPHKSLVKTVDGVDQVKHEDGFFYFSVGEVVQRGQIKSTVYSPIYAVKDSCVYEIEEVDSTDSE